MNVFTPTYQNFSLVNLNKKESNLYETKNTIKIN